MVGIFGLLIEAAALEAVANASKKLKKTAKVKSLI